MSPPNSHSVRARTLELLAKRICMQLSDSLWWFVLNMSADEPRDALVARLVDRLGVAVGGEDVAALASVLRDVPPLATNVKLTDEERMDLVILTWTVLRDNDFDVDPLYLIPLAAEALDTLLSRMKPASVVALPQLVDALALSAPAATKVALGQLARADVDPAAVLADDRLLGRVVTAVSHADIGVGSLAVRVLKRVASCGDAGVSRLLQPDVLAALHGGAADNPGVLLRVSEVYLSCAAQSDSAADLVAASTALAPLYAAISRHDDPVARLAATELLAQHVRTAQVVRMLESSGALSSLGAALADAGGLDGQLLAPGVLALFGTLACIPGVDREGLLTAHGALQCIEHAVREPREAGQVCPAALDAAAAIATTHGGLALLLGKMSNGFLPALRALVRGEEGTALSYAAMHAVARLIDQGEGDESTRDEDDAGAAKRLFDSIGDGAPDALVGSVVRKAKLPFGDESAAAYHLLQSIAAHEWGASALLHHASLYEWVIDRRGTTKEEREWKFAIAQRLYKFGDMAAAQRADIREFLRQGPHYTRGVTGELEMEVATLSS